MRLAKAIDPKHVGHITQHTDQRGPVTVDHDQEHTWTPPAYQGRQKMLQDAINHHDMIQSTPIGLGEQGIMPKGIVNHGGHRWILKNYHDAQRDVTPQHPIAGWAERTTQALYHAGDIGHLHQEVHHVTAKDQDGHEHPMVAIRVEPGVKPFYGKKAAPEHAHAAGQVMLMDFLTDNNDRHGGNLMLQGDGSPLAIDHGLAYQYRDQNDDVGNYRAGSAVSAWDLEDGHAHQLGQWWTQNAPAIRGAFQQRLGMIKSPEVRDHLARHFEARASHLDGVFHAIHTNTIPQPKQPEPGSGWGKLRRPPATPVTHLLNAPMMRLDPTGAPTGGHPPAHRSAAE